MSTAIQIAGIRVGHVQSPERNVRVNRPVTAPSTGPIDWGRVTREGERKSRVGKGKSGLIYRVQQSTEWQVSVIASRRRGVVIGSARMHDHALALAAMWEQAVLGGRVDMG